MTTFDPDTLEQDITVLQKSTGTWAGEPLSTVTSCARAGSGSAIPSRSATTGPWIAPAPARCAWEDSNPRPAA